MLTTLQQPPEIGELLSFQSFGKLVHRLVHGLPKLQCAVSMFCTPHMLTVDRLEAHAQPITRSLMRIDLTITPDFRWDDAIHPSAESFWILVEDVDGELILFHDQFILK